MPTVAATREALIALGDDDLALAYIEAIDWVQEEKKKREAYTGPRSDRIAFVD